MVADKDLYKSLDFLKNNFKNYYLNNDIELPDRFTRREFAFVFFGGRGMYRHVGFEKKSDVFSFISDRAPCHAYYSSAYYKFPDASVMDDKDWMGAELIFDLDSDHLPNADALSYSEQLDLVKDEFVKLVFDFLLDDFGFDKRNIFLYFSGGRGYHCHVKDPNVLDLDSNERREIVDYITGLDINDSFIFHDKATGKMDLGNRSVASGKSLVMPKPDDPGWKGRISRGIIEIISDIKDDPDPIEKLKGYGVKKSDAERLLDDLSEGRINRIKQGKIDQSKTIRKFFLNNALRKTAVSIQAGETDVPVTCDVKRLIRLPGSLHGKTGFQVKKISIDKLDDFEPLDDCIVFDDGPVKISSEVDFELEIKGNNYKVEKGVSMVPKFLAVFLVARKMANIF